MSKRTKTRVAVMLCMALTTWAGGALLSSAVAQAEHSHDTAAAHGDSKHGDSEHGDSKHGDSEHGDSEHAGHEFNWIYGFLGESEDIEESTLLYRKPGMPIPFAAYLINTSILFLILFKMGKTPLVEGLKKRRADIMQGMDEAAKMKADATAQLDGHRQRLDAVEAEVTRIKTEMQETAEHERRAVLADAKERKARMRKEAAKLLEQELKATQESLAIELAKNASSGAHAVLLKQITAADHQRVCDEYLASLDDALVQVGDRA